MDRKTAEGLMNKLVELPSGCKLNWPYRYYAYELKAIYLIVPNNSKKYCYYIQHTEERLSGENERRVHLTFFRGPYAASHIAAAYVNYSFMEEFDHASFRTSSVDKNFVRQRIREVTFNILVDRFWEWEYAVMPTQYDPEEMKRQVELNVVIPEYDEVDGVLHAKIHPGTDRQVDYFIRTDRALSMESTGPGLLMYHYFWDRDDKDASPKQLTKEATMMLLLSVLRTEDKMVERRKNRKSVKQE